VLYRKCLKTGPLQTPSFGTVLAVLQYVHAIITSVTALPETHTLVIVGAGLIVVSLFLRRILSPNGPATGASVKSGDVAKQVSQK
jgi:hypothetical protein